ncbi:MAG: carboxypeptidase regulatory-like domain-containing protein [Pyrinomonadaceae bacterium]
MSLPFRPASAAALLFIAALFSPVNTAAQTTTATKGTPPAATSTIAGRVTTSDGKPVASVGVALTPAQITSSADFKTLGSAKTDADGRYRIANVAAGRYSVQPLAPLYASQDNRQRGIFGGGQIVNVAAGESVEDIDIVLVRGGVITGRVTNAEGKPVIEERVMIYDADAMLQRGNAQPIDGSYTGLETDDRGIYRIYGVPPGRYLVSVGQARDGTVMFGPAAARYSRTFYPGSVDPTQAKVVEVSAGGETTGVDISLAEPPKSYEARGRVIDDRGNPVAGIGYGYGSMRGESKSLGAWGTDGGLTNEDGEFVMKNLTPGHYAAFAVNDFGSTPLDVYSDAVQFEIDDASVSGLVIKVHRGASISGTVALEGTTDRAVLARLQQVNISANVRPAAGTATNDQVNAPSFGQGGIKPDGTFRLMGLRPGKVLINIFNFGQTRGFVLLGVQRNGADAGTGIDVGEGEQVTGVRVRIGYGAGIVRGQIDVRDGGQPAALPAGARMNVSVRRAGAATPLPNMNGEVDARGRFVLEGLMGGEYELLIAAFAPRAPGTPPARLPVVRQIITVPDSGETSVTIVYDLNRQTEPNP